MIRTVNEILGKKYVMLAELPQCYALALAKSV